jgi:hypothetical protein
MHSLTLDRPSRRLSWLYLLPFSGYIARLNFSSFRMHGVNKVRPCESGVEGDHLLLLLSIILLTHLPCLHLQANSPLLARQYVLPGAAAFTGSHSAIAYYPHHLNDVPSTSFASTTLLSCLLIYFSSIWINATEPTCSKNIRYYTRSTEDMRKYSSLLPLLLRSIPYGLD